MANQSSRMNAMVESPTNAPTAATRSTSELHLEGISTASTRQDSNDERTDKSHNKKSQPSPSSPRNFRFFSSKNDKNDRNPNILPGGISSNALVGDTNRSYPTPRSNVAMPNDSLPSLHHAAIADEASSVHSGVSGLHEALRSDESVNRIRSGSSSNIAEHQRNQRGDGLSRKTSQRQKHPLSSRSPIEEEPKTAPLRPERPFGDILPPQQFRNRSADRSAVESDDERLPSSSSKAPSLPGQSGFFNNFKHQGSRAADGIGNAGNRFWKKFGRSGSANEKESSPGPGHPTEEHSYRVIKRSVVDQTRITRIRKSMEAARDKTEYWMPSLPYRAIDYLNHHGILSEGLYRVPGSATEVKALQRRFDTGPYYDTDLLEDENLPDVNAVASMMKAWIRDLPEPLLPKQVANTILEHCDDPQKTPQAMRDALSNLPPYNYYLLFAITCHISLVHSHSKINKMDYNALSICFQHSLQIDSKIFELLVCDWRNCWQGCFTESEYLQQEAAIREAPMNRVDTRAPNQTSRPSSRPTTSRSPERQLINPPHQPPPPPPSSSEGRPTVETPAPFSQDLRHPGKIYSSRQQSPAPKLEPVQNISPMRM